MPDVDPTPKPKRRRRWLRGIFVGALVGALLVAGAALLAVRHLDWIAQFAIHRLFPGVTAELGSVRTVSLNQVEVKKLVLRSAKTREPLLTLAGGSITFRFTDVWHARLQEVRLDGPDLVISPDLGEALGVRPSQASAAAPGGRGITWGIDRLVVTDGHLRVTRFAADAPNLEMGFAADLRNFGVGDEAAKVEQHATLRDIAATDAKGRSLLRLAGADLTFTTAELFTQNRLRAVRIGAGKLTVAQSLFDLATAAPGSTATPGWSVGDLALDGVDVTVPDVPGAIGRVAFHIVATLRDLGAAGTPGGAAEQRVLLTKVGVSTDREPTISLFAAAEAEARFTIAGLAEHHLTDLRLRNAAIDFAPAALAADTAKTSSPAPAAPPSSIADAQPPTWLIDHASCNYGTLRLRVAEMPAITAKFAFDTQQLGTLGDAAAQSHDLTLWDVQAADGATPFLSLDVATVTFTPKGLLEQQRIDAVKIDGGRLTVGDTLQKLLARPSAPAPAGAPPATSGGGWSIGTLDIAGVRTRLEDRRPGVPDLFFTLNTTLRNVQAGDVSSGLLEEVQTVEFANIDLRSPINRTAKILSLRSVFVRFSLRDLANKHLREVTILNPTIFLSQDLFVYMERATAAPDVKPVIANPAAVATVAPIAPAGPDWSVDHLEVKFGRLVIGSGGSKDVGLPLEFETKADNLSLDNLAALQLRAVLRVPKQSYDFADYQLAVQDVEGDLRFSYPPEKGKKNLVQKLDIGSIHWRQYRTKKSWVAATFDASGINGQFGAESYGGYLNGGFSFFFQDDSPWIGWLAGTGIDTEALTDILSPQNFRMTGPVDFEVQLDAFRKDIQRVRGTFHLTEAGKFKIGKLDNLLANIPEGWSAIKQSSTRIALETLRDFDYTKAGGDFWFVENQGLINLDLSGPHGSRRFEAALHDGQETTHPWQTGTLGKK